MSKYDILFTIGENVTMKRLNNVIGNYMRVIPHTNGTMVVDIRSDVFYIIKSISSRTYSGQGIYQIVFVGLLDRLMLLLANGKLPVAGKRD